MSRRKLGLVLMAALAAGAVAAGIAGAGRGDGNDKTFEYAIGLWGDMPYSDTQALTGVPNLIADMNSQDIEFSVHDGDLKAGNAIAGSVTPTTCQSAQQPSIYSQGLGYFNLLQKPAIFTPGDNDWTDGLTATERRTAASTRSSDSSTSAGSSSRTIFRSDSTRCSSRCRRRRCAREPRARPGSRGS